MKLSTLMSTYNIHVDDQSFDIKTDDLTTFDLHQMSKTNFHVLQNNQAFDAVLIAENMLEKTLTIAVNGNHYDIKIDDAYDAIVAQMGLLANTATKFNTIKAPMPGLIINIMVNAGDTIEKGTPLFVLSAMKMENIVLSDGAGIIRTIEVSKKDSVDKGQLIIKMEE
jgi:biotin carboxyl carrier protein